MRYRPGPMHVIGIALVTCLALAGCASTGAATPNGTQAETKVTTEAIAIVPTETPAPASKAAAINTPQPTLASAQPTQTETPTQENTPVPTATSYPAPAVPLSPTGPWLVFKGGYPDPDHYYGIQYLWAMNQDGTGLTRLTEECVDTYAVRPNSAVQDGFAIAYSTSLDGSCQRKYPPEPYHNALKVLLWPERTVTTVVSNYLLPYHSHDRLFAASAAYNNKTLLWSPSGSKIAFVGGIDGYDTTSNVFVYDMTTKHIVCISANNDTVNYVLDWSSDERYVVHSGFLFSAMWDPSPQGMWSARTDASGITLLTAAMDEYISELDYLGWFSPTEVILVPRDWKNNADIRVTSVETGKYASVGKELLFDIAYSPEHNTFLMTQWPSAPPNTLLIFYDNGARREIAGYGIKWVKWLIAYDTFLGQTPDGQSYLVSPDGILTEIPSPAWHLKRSHPLVISPDNRWWAWHHYHSIEYEAAISASELWVGPALSQPSILLSFDSADKYDYSSDDGVVPSSNVLWSPDSQYLVWAARGGIWVASPPNFEAALVAKIGATFQDAVWVE